MRIVFMGSADVSGAMLDALMRSPWAEVVGVVTQPDRPSGRRLQLMPCPGKARAVAHGLPVICPEKVNHPDVLAQIGNWEPDVVVVVAYGQFLGRRLLALPRLGCVNIHLSLLPRFRGAAPIQWAIAAGDDATGVTAILMDEGMDSGDILMQAVEPIRADDTAGSLYARVTRLGACVLCETLPRWAEGALPRMPQDPAGVVLAPKLHKHDGLIDWTADASVIERRVRAFNPWPACHTGLPPHLVHGSVGARLKVWDVAVLPGYRCPNPAYAPGTICEVSRHGEGPVVLTGRGALRLLDVQPEAGKRMSGSAFICGHRLQAGDQFGDGSHAAGTQDNNHRSRAL
jgi:methionyl-tRNA formyltransferase